MAIQERAPALRRYALVILGVAFTASLVSSAGGALGIGDDVARRASDVPWPTGRTDPNVVVVEVDAASQASFGAWPWSRDQQAALVQAIADDGATLLGYDIIPTEESPGIDDRLAAAMTALPTVVPTAYSSLVRNSRGLYTGSEPVAPAADVAQAATAVGHVVVPSDPDGVVRRVPLVIETPEGVMLPSFSLRLAMAAADQTDANVIVRPRSVEAGGLSAPVEAAAALRVWWGSGFVHEGRQVVSAADLLDGRAEGRLTGAIVLVGVADPTVGDTHITPMRPGATTPGVIVQAQALSTLLRGEWVFPATWWLSALIVFVLGAGVAAALARGRIWIGLLVTAAVVASYVFLGVLLLPLTGIQFDLVRVPAAILLTAMATLLVRLAREQRSRRAAARLFSRYVPEAVARRLLEGGGESLLANGSRVWGAVLFCDLRGFTPLVSRSDADTIRQALDRYYDYVCERVFARGGTVMQFVGDEVFAVFGAPEEVSDPVAAARDTAEALVAERAELDDALAAAGLPHLSFGIGLAAGELVAGAVGPPSRRQYAVVGDAVNVGSRLCGAAAAGEIIASADFADDGWPSAEREMLAVKGKDHPIEVVRLARVRGGQRT